ncbi:structural maintenance of chromosome domain-containing protein, putative [Eimeria necatrix]|uniref:Structural maintenance of chromosome domain-containing protein, putative n=1 Tax=Eimeria necatrix TaxID=51315 RepID=U6MYZ8_9EIME|nr:structural maintenance of chromosome domain-containing protein, putative [Eimeria necatrix]CDJ68268.1 structural maintenance of chromosome domain-containing protein, putative [Eimeria necatrix]
MSDLFALLVIFFSSKLGHNGSGKSNVLLGVSFVLGEIGNSAAERRLLLHEGIHGRVASGFVELTLNNANRQLCMFNADSVVIRRSFSLSADDITVQGNLVRSLRLRAFVLNVFSKAEFEQLIECASLSGGGDRVGRSGTSSTFIIHQGRIQEVALLSAAGRLRLLLSAGSGAFIDAKAKETEQLLQQAAVEQDTVTRTLNDLEKQLNDMDKERQELRLCVEMEKEKSHIEAAIHQADWLQATETLRQLEQQQEKHRSSVRRLAAAAAEAESMRDEAATQLANCKLKPSASPNPTILLQCQETRLRLESGLLAERAETQQQKSDTAKRTLEEKKRQMRQIREGTRGQLEASACCCCRCLSKSTAGTCAAARQAAIKEELKETEQQQRADAAEYKQNKRKAELLRKEVEEAQMAAAAKAAAAAAAAAIVKEMTKQISSLKTPLEEVVEQQRQQQARLSNLLQQRNAAATSIRTATEEIAKREGWDQGGGIAAPLASFLHALEAVARLKQQQQEQKGSLLQRKCCVSVVPIKEVAEQQQRQNSRRHQQLQQPGEHATALETYVHTVFSRSLLVPSLDTPEVQRFRLCQHRRGCILRFWCHERRRAPQGRQTWNLFRKKHKDISVELDCQQQMLVQLQKRHKELLQQEQILIEKRMEAYHNAETALAEQQQSEMAHRAATSLLSALKEEETATATRAAARKQLVQSLRHEALHARQPALTAAEEQQLKQLPQLLQQQQEQLLQLLRRVEETAGSISKAEQLLEVSLRRAIDRVIKL